MPRYKLFSKAIALCLILTTSNCLLLAEAVASIPTPAPQVEPTGQQGLAAIRRETRPRQESRLGNSVDAATGAFVLEQPILMLQGIRTLEFNLTYNSLLTNRKGPMGFGWSHNFEAFVEGDPNGIITVHWDQNRENSFAFVSENEPYQPLDEAVLYDRIFRRVSGDGWRMVRLNGDVYEFNEDGTLDRVGNKVLQYLEPAYFNGRLNGVREPVSGQRIDFYYNLNGLLETIVDSLNFQERRIYLFSYDSSDRLTTIRPPVTLGEEFGNCCPNLSIPDNDPAGLVYEIEVSRSEPIGLLQVTVGTIDHSRPQDLRVTLTSPEGTELLLYDGQPLANGNLSFRQRAFADFEGENPEGTWRVRILDSASGSTGMLNGWAMRFSDQTNPIHYSYSENLITAATGPDGEQIFTNSYDSLGRVVEQDDGVSGNLTGTFDYQERPGGGLVTNYHNRLGDLTRLEHDDGFHLVQLTDALGNVSSWSYNENGDRIRAVDPLGGTSMFDYDSDGNLTTVVDPAGFVSTFEYVSNNVISIRDALGKETRFSYDPNNNLRRITDALGNEDNKTYNGNSQITSNLLAGRGGINIQYQGGYPVSLQHPAEPGQLGMQHDAFGRVTRIVDLAGFETTIEYNSTDQVVKQTDHLGNSTVSVYDRRDRLVSKIDPKGNETRFEYDGNGNLIAMTDAAGKVTRYVYDGEDRLLRTIDPAGHVGSVAYDPLGRVIQETDPLGNSVSHEYDALGNEISTVDAGGVNVKEVDYDERGFPIVSRDAYGHTIEVDYDAVGRITRTEDPLGRASTYTYDALDRPTSFRDALGRVASKEYWPDDFVRYLVDPLGRRTEFTYDPARRLTRVISPTGRNTRLEYNNRDLVTEVQKASGRVHNFDYDSVDRLTGVSSSGPGGLRSVGYLYDAAGNLTRVFDRLNLTDPATLIRTYDPLNRLTSFTNAAGDTIGYSYDEAGNLASLVYPDGKQVHYSYDAANRLTRITDWGDRITLFAWNGNNQLTRVDFPNGTRRVLEYDDAGRVSKRQDFDAENSLIVGYTYSYDAAGRISAEIQEQQEPEYSPPTVSMTYDNENQLQTFNGQSTSFDADGNMTRGPLGDGFRDFTYDVRGNLIRAGEVTYAYDLEDHLVSITDSQGTSRFTLSPSGDLAQVIQKAGPGGKVTRYVYGVGLAYEVTGSEVRVYHYDHRGSTTAFSDGSGQVVGRVSYGPFGEIIERSGESDSPFLFTGLLGVITDSNGLNYMRFRWYSPQIKRFVSVDSGYGDINLPHTLNRYAYTGNNPISRVDPGGEFLNLIGAALIGGVVSTVIKVVSDAISGRRVDFTNGDYLAEIGGAFVAGAATGACLGSGVGIAAGAACGGLGSSLGYLTTAGLKGDQVDPGQLAFEAGVGAVSGAATAGAARFLRFGPRTSAGNRFAQFRQGFAAENPTAFKLGLLARDRAVMGSDEYLVAVLLPKAGVRKLIGTTPGKEIAKALARRAFTPTFGILAGGSLAVKVGGRIASNILFNSQSGGVAGGGDDNIDKEEEGRDGVSGGIRGTYGEFIHWQLYISSLMLAGRPIPTNPNHVLSTF